ncbi:MAG: orotidine 5'-phosphate decarboxylase [Thermoproteales archaeon]|nr:orotidine 5'-phosphate decarboxylase [Thermoproteales archaeon]
MVKIQVALDFIDKQAALNIASKIFDIKEIILEAGTPLIKSVGINILKELKERFPERPLLADMKTMDVGDIEAELAFINGADYTTVLGVASRETIRKVIKTARKYNAKAVIDLIGINDIKYFLAKIEDLHPDVLCIHRGIDVEVGGEYKTLHEICNVIKFLKENTGYEIAVAGGITDRTARMYVECGADILVIGRYITRSSNPREAVNRILENIK